jgi:protein-S-isoprenylcysteine O-methyltransferase Ste14
MLHGESFETRVFVVKNVGEMTWLRHLLSIAILPFSVTVLLPVWIARSNSISFSLGTSVTDIALQLAGVALLVVGLTFFIWSLRHFAVEGQGTLAPWDPPRNLVVRGPYRYVRNPMISGVLMIVLGEAAILRSWPIFVWAVIFFGLNALWIPLFEEPQLAERFGDSYREYCRHVPRVIPRVTPWNPNERPS